MSYNVYKHIRDSIATLAEAECWKEVEAAALVTKRAILDGGKLLIAGNGGSAADAQHLAAEFVNRLTVDRKALPAIALTTDTSALTAIANDSDFWRVFSRQIEAIGKPGDIFLAISTSGKSGSILTALEAAKKIGLITIGLTGQDRKSPMCGWLDYSIHVPSKETMHIQEAHLVVEHIFAALVESELENL